jgi:hypothetical protein
MTGERTPLDGKVDFTMMYVAHDAFTRDVHRMAVASERGLAWTPETQAGWAIFTKQLHVHSGIPALSPCMTSAARERAAFFALSTECHPRRLQRRKFRTGATATDGAPR